VLVNSIALKTPFTHTTQILELPNCSHW